MYVLNISHVRSLTSSPTALGFAGSPPAKEERAGPHRHRLPRAGDRRCSPGSGEAAPAPSPVPMQGANRLIQHFNCSVYRVHFQRHAVTKQNRVI